MHRPHIMIYRLQTCPKSEEKNPYAIQDFFFLTQRAALRFFERHKVTLQDYDWSIGGETLWIF